MGRIDWKTKRHRNSRIEPQSVRPFGHTLSIVGWQSSIAERAITLFLGLRAARKPVALQGTIVTSTSHPEQGSFFTWILEDIVCLLVELFDEVYRLSIHTNLSDAALKLGLSKKTSAKGLARIGSGLRLVSS